ncbi:MAG: hypothetical protein HKP20_04845 [Akkermansiaceae bacterium]|nr:hypothetical protein [Akkermansiaceae bacterium]
MVGIIAFYTVITKNPTPETLDKGKLAEAPATISNEQTRQIIETNLRRFLEAENIEQKARYVSMEEEEIDHLRTYYTLRGRWERPLWKVERIYPMKSSQEKIWFVTYLDLERRRHTVSFERFGNDFLIHWSAMTGFCDIPWPDFIVQRPLGPVTMRCFIRQYEGIWPVNISQDKYQCFIIEDRQKLFYEIAIMKSDAYGCDILSKLPNTRRHPVTVELGYRRAGTSEHGKQLTIISLKHLRWQKLGVDPRNPSQPPSD